MPRKFVTSIVAAAMAITSFSAVPAAAGNRNLERFIIGAGTLLIIGSALKHRHDYHYQHGHHGKKYKKKKRCTRVIKTRHGYRRVRCGGRRH